MKKIQRNEPCTCGSGKKYKKCCMGKQQDSLVQEIREDIHDLIGGQCFDSMEELQAVLGDYNQQKNTTPVDDFHGISSEQMHRFLHFSFDTPELVTFTPVLQNEPESKAAFLLSKLLGGIGDDGIKLTAKGNLGLKFCQEASKQYFSHYPESMTLQPLVRSETNFEPLHTIRLAAQLGGLVRKYKGKLLLTKKCRKALQGNGLREVYPLLIQAYLQKFNWGYRDGYNELPFVQQSFLFSMYLLHKYGASWRPTAFYSDIFLQAFPMILREIEPKLYESPEETLKRCYTLRTLHRFADFFGLVDVEQVSDEALIREYRVRAGEMLGEVVQWHL